MSQYTHFSLSFKKGLRANIAKMVVKGNGSDRHMEMMLFLVPNSDNNEIEPAEKAKQIVNAYFSNNVLSALKEYGVGDYVRIGFDRIGLAKGTHQKTGEAVFSLSVDATSIELLRKAPEKKTASKEKHEANVEQLKKAIA